MSKENKEIKENSKEEEFRQLKEKADLADQYFDKLLRIQAEADNLKKRLSRERLDIIKYANEDLIAEFLTILDDYERTLQAAEANHELDTLICGVKMINNHMAEVLERRGLKVLGEVGQKFDPAFHDAVEHLETDAQPEGTIVEVLRKGYALNDKVIRPAAVKVAKGKKPETSNQ